MLREVCQNTIVETAFKSDKPWDWCHQMLRKTDKCLLKYLSKYNQRFGLYYDSSARQRMNISVGRKVEIEPTTTEFIVRH